MSDTNVPLCFSRAREEVLLALGAASDKEADEHKKLADEYITEAVHDLQREPERDHNWSGLRRKDRSPA